MSIKVVTQGTHAPAAQKKIKITLTACKRHAFRLEDKELDTWRRVEVGSKSGKSG